MFVLTAVAGISAIFLRLKLTGGGGQSDGSLSASTQNQRKRTAWILTLLSCFAGGVFMGTCFLDIFPHINEHYEHFRDKTQWEMEFPFPQFFICCGFFLVYLLEELILKVFASSEQRKQKQALAKFGANIANVEQFRSAPFAGCSKPDCAVGAGSVLNSLNNTLKPCSSCLNMLTHETVITKYLDSSKKVDLLKSFTFAFAISFHSVLEGLAMGFQETSTGITTLFVSLIIHKAIEAFSVGLQLSKSRSNSLVCALIGAYALMTPLGAIAGDFITTLDIDDIKKDAIIIILESMAGGTFIYVTFLEVLAQERAKEHSHLIQLGAIFLGFLVINALQVYEQFADAGHGHHHAH
uniref:Zinc transporter ZIP3 n=1 Tax=Globodera pallida TaxID=36090 RepID=A0A183BIR9_GLOPA